MEYDLIALRKKLREAIVVHQIRLPEIARGSGVSSKVLGEFLSDGDLDEQRAMYLHSWLYYQREAVEKDVGRMERGEYVPLSTQFRVFKAELRREYNVAWWLERDFMKLNQRRRLLELAHMEERCKAEFLKAYADKIHRLHIRFPDGLSYWRWKAKLGKYASREEIASWRLRSAGAGEGDYREAAAEQARPRVSQRPRSLLWRS